MVLVVSNTEIQKGKRQLSKQELMMAAGTRMGSADTKRRHTPDKMCWQKWGLKAESHTKNGQRGLFFRFWFFLFRFGQLGRFSEVGMTVEYKVSWEGDQKSLVSKYVVEEKNVISLTLEKKLLPYLHPKNLSNFVSVDYPQCSLS